MKCTFSEIRNKEIICTEDGARLGFADDIEIDTETGKMLSLIIFGRPRAMGILGRGEDIVIECGDIKKIGEDIVLVSGYDHYLSKINKNSRVNLFD